MDPATIMMIVSTLSSMFGKDKGGGVGGGGGGRGGGGGFMSGGGGQFLGALAGGIGQGLLSGGGGPSGPEKNVLNARATQARTQAAGTNSRALQELMRLFLGGGTGRGGF